MKILDGRTVAAERRVEWRERAEALGEKGIVPALRFVRFEGAQDGGYGRSILRAAGETGVDAQLVDVEPSTDAALRVIGDLADDDAIHGLGIITPVPAGVDVNELAAAIPPAKDIDGASSASAGRLFAGLPSFAPATAQAVITLCDAYDIELEGRHAVVVGRSRVVGKPLALLLLDRNATVTICHSRTADLAAETRAADLLVAATGQPGLIRASGVRPDAVVIDVGTTYVDGQVLGDVDADGLDEVAAAFAPAVGGVGPLTTTQLMANVVTAASRDL
jgi:methylenetetrahydrofolate dehydrogenase (NADP+) / methenyltetrahydrofolate cyclohydrolase